MSFECPCLKKPQTAAVTLRVYDISDGIASVWSPVILGKKLQGIWHTGIYVYGMEYFYGGGIVKMKPEDVTESYGIQIVQEHYLGETKKTQKEFEQYLFSIRDDFCRDCYDLIKWNCNNFTDHAARYLIKRGIPKYILDLPEQLTRTFMGKIIVNFIRLFSETPAIDSNAAHHPKQTLLVPASPARRKTCPVNDAIYDNNESKKKLQLKNIYDVIPISRFHQDYNYKNDCSTNILQTPKALDLTLYRTTDTINTKSPPRVAFCIPANDRRSVNLLPKVRRKHTNSSCRTSCSNASTESRRSKHRQRKRTVYVHEETPKNNASRIIFRSPIKSCSKENSYNSNSISKLCASKILSNLS